jgi:hypothetical protein
MTMNNKITCFLPAGDRQDLKQTLEELKSSGVVGDIFVLVTGDTHKTLHLEGIQQLVVSSLTATETLRKIAIHTQTGYALLYTKTLPLILGSYALERMIQIAGDTISGMVYSDYYAVKRGQLTPNPVIDYQDGSLRDDFNFGSLLLFETAAFIEAVSRIKENYSFAGLYDLRLKLSQKYRLFHIPELLYTEVENDIRKSGEKLFDYVDPKNREVQIEMEMACTEHLKDTGAWLAPRFNKIHFNEGNFENEVSVIIPVKNRAKTIGDAITSVLMQKTDFRFNLIIIDNHSQDGTGEIIRSFSKKDQRIIHFIPPRNDLGIGGCWNEAIFYPLCGKFAVQLDSDDLYINDTVLSRVVAAFYEQNCAMLVGTYKMVNFKLEDLPPGIIDHKEWTPDNGRNNALRINGLGAPRAFYTPVIRRITVPNVSYGEDYALGLSISRYYQIGRIYEPLYLCRRWEENSDSSLDIEKQNIHNFYKDKIRTIEFRARQQYVQEGQEV